MFDKTSVSKVAVALRATMESGSVLSGPRRTECDGYPALRLGETDFRRGLELSLASLFLSVIFAFAWTESACGSDPSSASPAPGIKATDCDNHTVILNKPGVISLVIGTSEDSQDAARSAARAMYPFQGKTDFQFAVVVDLRDSIAAWVPSIVINRMRKSLDIEAVTLKTYFLKNGNKEDPRLSSHAVPDFKGTIVPELNWNGRPDQLHAILFGADGREIQRWENVDNMEKLQSAVRSALQAFEAHNPKQKRE